MNTLELRHLKRLCDKYGIDYYEVDNKISYWENKEHIQSLIRMISRSLDTFEIERMAELQKQYMKEHLIAYYLACQMAGETSSTDTGPPVEEHQFSLKDYIKAR